MISTIEEVDNLDSSGYYYRPKIYLSKNLFTKEILLDVFCSEYLVTTFEDDYYNDLNIDMIIKYQPHINKEEFLLLWEDLDQILIVQQYCNFIRNYPNYVVLFLYNSISEYIKITNINEFNKKILPLLENNKYVIKYNLYEKIQMIVNSDDLDKMKDYAKDILSNIPNRYSLILPL